MKIVYMKPDASRIFSCVKGLVGVIVRTKGFDSIFVDFGKGIKYALKSNQVEALKAGDIVSYKGEDRKVIGLGEDGTILLTCSDLSAVWVNPSDIKIKLTIGI